MSHPVSEKSALVVSAHSADFVWRAGGAIALHALQGYQNSLISATIRCAPIKRRCFVWRMCIAVSSPTLS